MQQQQQQQLMQPRQNGKQASKISQKSDRAHLAGPALLCRASALG